MTGPLGRSPRIWAAYGDTSVTLPPGPSGRSQVIRARTADCVPDLPPGPSGRSRIIRIPGGLITDYFTRTTTPHWGDWYNGDTWGDTDGNVRVHWGGSQAYCWVDGSAGIIRISDTTPYGVPVWNQQQHMYWNPHQHYPDPNPDPNLDALFEMRLTRELVYDSGDGDYFYLMFGNNQWDPDPPGDWWDGAFAVYFTAFDGISAYTYSDDMSYGPVDIPVPLSDAFKVRVLRAGVDAPVEVYLWASTDSTPGSAAGQPASPTFSFETTSTYLNRGLQIYLGTDNATCDQLDLRLEWLDIDGSETWASLQ